MTLDPGEMNRGGGYKERRRVEIKPGGGDEEKRQTETKRGVDEERIAVEIKCGGG